MRSTCPGGRTSSPACRSRSLQAGYFTVPDTPGLGIELNDDVVKQHLRRPGYFEPTPMFDDFIVSGFNSGGAWPHYDDAGKWCDCVTYQ